MCKYRSDRTHIEDTKDSVEIRPPGSDHLFIITRVIASRDRIPLALLNDVSLDLGDSPNRELSKEPHSACVASSLTSSIARPPGGRIDRVDLLAFHPFPG